MDELDALRLDAGAYEVKTCTLEGRTIVYRAWEGLPYCGAPADPIQTLNVFAPACLFDGTGAYTCETAPIYLPNAVGGYKPAPAAEPAIDPYAKGPSSIFCALEHGYVVVSAGLRGRTSGLPEEEAGKVTVEGAVRRDFPDAAGRPVGRAPALIVDCKAAIRWVRYNADVIPGCVDRIVANGSSAGGALSSLAGATGNAAEYGPYLAAIGALDERDDIFAASCYCPVQNLENSDSAYEWLFFGHDDYHPTAHVLAEDGTYDLVSGDEEMTAEQVAFSKPLKDLFPGYVNGLGLVDPAGRALTLDADGTGSFGEWVARWVRDSAQRELDTHENERGHAWLMAEGSQIDCQGYLRVEDGKVVGLDWDGFVSKIARLKPAPAFDAVDLGSVENEEFGDGRVDARHFTAFSMEHNTADGAGLADPAIVRLMNPVPWIAEGRADVAPHWRIRHGAFDRDTSLAIPVILATMLANRGYDVDFALPWGIPHAGNYDLPELFAWIDGLCGKGR